MDSDVIVYQMPSYFRCWRVIGFAPATLRRSSPVRPQLTLSLSPPGVLVLHTGLQSRRKLWESKTQQQPSPKLWRSGTSGSPPGDFPEASFMTAECVLPPMKSLPQWIDTNSNPSHN